MNREIEKIIKLITEMTVPKCTPRENSEYHLGFNDARMNYVEEQIKNF